MKQEAKKQTIPTNTKVDKKTKKQTNKETKKQRNKETNE